MLKDGDKVKLKVENEKREKNIMDVRKKRRDNVDEVKGLFGFMKYEVDEGKKMLFNMYEVKDGIRIKKGEKVEFVIVKKKSNGK
jgi:cold shock CspA family protein